MKKKRFPQIVPGYMLIPLAFSLTANFLVYFASRIFTTNLYHYDMTLKIDEMTPFVPWTVVIYYGCYLFWIINYILGCRQDKEEAFHLMSAEVLSRLGCLLFYVFLPTTNVRPAVDGTTVFDAIMRLLYQIDAADNLFPSIHCLVSWFCVIAVRKNPKVNKKYKIFSYLVAFAVFVSTLTTKQHVIVDVLSGVLLAEGSYWFVKKTGFERWYERVTCNLYDLIRKRFFAVNTELEQ